MNASMPIKPMGRLVATRFVNKRAEIPADIRVHNVSVLRRAAAAIGKSVCEPTIYMDTRGTSTRAESLAALTALWDQCDTTFAAFDVVAVDPVREAYDTAPFNGGNYPRAPRPRWSEIGSTAGMCADAAG